MQYMFSIPEGFARLALEHGVRPGGGLVAAFASRIDSASLVRHFEGQITSRGQLKFRSLKPYIRT